MTLMIVSSCFNSSVLNFLSFSDKTSITNSLNKVFVHVAKCRHRIKALSSGTAYIKRSPLKCGTSFVANHTFRLSNQSSVRPFEAFPNFQSLDDGLAFSLTLALSIHFAYIHFTRSTRKSLAHINSTTGRFNLRFSQLFYFTSDELVCLP